MRLTSTTLEADTMYRLMFRKSGAESWNGGLTFSDEKLTPEAKGMLAERSGGLPTAFWTATSTPSDRASEPG